MHIENNKILVSFFKHNRSNSQQILVISKLMLELALNRSSVIAQ